MRLLTPFDPVVWDRQRFELFWGWQYRFEAYTPAAKRKLGYYALPLLWGEQVIGWGNLTYAAGSLESSFGYLAGRAPREAAYRKGLEAELDRIRIFLEPRLRAPRALRRDQPRQVRNRPVSRCTKSDLAVISHPAALHLQRLIREIGAIHAGQAHVDRAPLHVQTVARHPTRALVQHGVGLRRAIARNHAEHGLDPGTLRDIVESSRAAGDRSDAGRRCGNRAAAPRPGRECLGQ